MGPLNQFVGRGKDGLGPRGGTLCFGDSDLRPIYDRHNTLVSEISMKTESSMFPVHFRYVIYNVIYCYIYILYIYIYIVLVCSDWISMFNVKKTTATSTGKWMLSLPA